MASPRQIINDLRAQAARLDRTGNDGLVKSLLRAAEQIEVLLDDAALMKAALEILAEGE
ncbi:hypothetical protein [Oceanisphaera sp.]|uniref:hypothetical protein n=1 Tax=Oceanisphaera sp. TaxID=1929979 RepID=UPI003A918904